VNIRFAAGLLFVAAGVAHAQSNVTLYGRIDNGFQYLTGLAQGHQLGLESGNWAPSEFGLKGSEDLGGGSKAIFQLEAGIDTLNGASMGSLFGRQATVGLTNDRWGTFKLGNMGIYEIGEDSFFLDPQVFQMWSLATLVRGRNWSMAGNGLEYTSPTFGGVTLKGQYDLTNSTTWNAGNPGSGPGQLGGAQGRSDGVEAQYDIGQLELRAIYDEIRDPNGQFSSVYVASRSILAGGTYTLSQVKIFAGYQHLSAPNASNEGYFGTATPTAQPAGVSLPTAVDHEWVGATWQASVATSLTGAVYHANANKGNGNATLYTLAGTYDLSKRTFLYAELAWIHNSKTSNLGLSGGGYGANINNDPVNGSVDNTNPDYGHGQFGAGTGIVMQF
jgi:predicted porin